MVTGFDFEVSYFIDEHKDEFFCSQCDNCNGVIEDSDGCSPAVTTCDNCELFIEGDTFRFTYYLPRWV